jgi:hypothetical protein
MKSRFGACPVTPLTKTYAISEGILLIPLYTISVVPAIVSRPNAMVGRTPKKESARRQTAAANQKHPATAKQPTLTHLAIRQFTSSSKIPTIGRITSKANSKST